MHYKRAIAVLGVVGGAISLAPILLGFFIYNRANIWFLSGKLNDDQLALRQAEIMTDTALSVLSDLNVSERVSARLMQNLLALEDTDAVEAMIDRTGFVPDSSLLWYLGDYYWSQGDRQTAYYYWSQFSGVSAVAFYHALQCKESGRVNLAMDYFDIGFDFNQETDLSKYVDTYLQFVDLYVARGDIDRAIAIHQQVAASGYRVAWNNMQLGNLYYRYLMDYPTAESYFRQVRQDASNFYRIEMWLGLALTQQGKLNEAVDMFLSGIERMPKDGLQYFELARAYLALGESALAKAYFEKSLDLAPASGVGEYRYVERARIALAGLAE